MSTKTIIKKKTSTGPKKTAIKKVVRPATRKAVRPTKLVSAEASSPAPVAAPVHAGGAYVYAVGRRKSAVARVRVYTKRASGIMTINGKPHAEYMPIRKHQESILSPFTVSGIPQTDVTVVVNGGGVRAQSESIRHGIARALIRMDPSVRIPLKRAGLLTRDPRVKERKKYGLKRARRAPQWQKR